MKKKTLILFGISSVLITMFLFFIDEGYYNFNWMLRWGNWVAFIIYVVPVFLGQLVVYKLIPERFHGKGKTTLSVLLGATLGILLIVNIIFANMK
jgi:hypothetical protein